MVKLTNALAHLADWRKARTAKQRKSLCLTAIRYAVGKEGLSLPASYSHFTAMQCWERLWSDPGYWGWKAVHHDTAGNLPEPCLVFFKNCGKLPDGRVAGHIAIVQDGKLYANETYALNAYWKARIVGAFVPLG